MNDTRKGPILLISIAVLLALAIAAILIITSFGLLNKYAYYPGKNWTPAFEKEICKWGKNLAIQSVLQ